MQLSIIVCLLKITHQIYYLTSLKVSVSDSIHEMAYPTFVPDCCCYYLEHRYLTDDATPEAPTKRKLSLKILDPFSIAPLRNVTTLGWLVGSVIQSMKFQGQV